MAKINCNVCGKKIKAADNSVVVRCKYCGSTQSVIQTGDSTYATDQNKNQADISGGMTSLPSPGKPLTRSKKTIAVIIACIIVVLTVGLIFGIKYLNKPEPEITDSQRYYEEAEELLSEEKYDKAAIAFGKAGDYKDAEERSYELWSDIRKPAQISTGVFYTIGIEESGNVIASGYGDPMDAVDDWRDIVAVSTGYLHMVGLKDDGTVVATEEPKHFVYNERSDDVDDWENIVAVAAGYGRTVGLKKDGTVVTTEWSSDDYGENDVGTWTDIVAVSVYHDIIGLKKDGTVVYSGASEEDRSNIKKWKDIIAVSEGAMHSVGLKSDGTVVATGYNEYGSCNVEDWKDIKAIGTGTFHTVGLKNDGTVVATGDNEYGQCDVKGWKNIVAIAVGGNHTVGIKKDGTIVVTGDNTHGELDIKDWKNIRMS